MTIRIYELRDPRSGEVRYIGKTSMLLCQRLSGHMQCNQKTHSGRWIASLVALGLRPTIHLVEECDRESWAQRERFWIAHHRSIGTRLTNISEGGDGHDGFNTSLTTREKLSAANNGKKRSPEFSAKLSAAMKGRVRSDEQRQKLSMALAGRVVSEETRKKLSAALKGRKKPPRTEDHCLKIAEKARGRVRSQEAKAAVSAKLKAYASTPEGRKKLSDAGKARHRAALEA
ncbi:NUMOD3 domain-containing DNA-binding protein [Ralstonia solanacearum]|uniref:NUMOD3 domain-containing DNA-binding protein n=1 Tax=Ralstonia solanacearum TaxID=305 RepID=UPI003D8016B9